MAPDPLLAEMLRECERVIDHHARAGEAFDRKAERFMALGVAALGGGATLGLLTLERVGTGAFPHVALLLAIGGVTNAASLVLVIDSYGGFGRGLRLHVGPDLDWLAAKAGSEEWTMESHYVSSIVQYGRLAHENVGSIARAAARHRAAVVLLLSALIAYSGAYLYVIAGGMST